jgi:hypothetical protein
VLATPPLPSSARWAPHHTHWDIFVVYYGGILDIIRLGARTVLDVDDLDCSVGRRRRNLDSVVRDDDSAASTRRHGTAAARPRLGGTAWIPTAARQGTHGHQPSGPRHYSLLDCTYVSLVPMHLLSFLRSAA